MKVETSPTTMADIKAFFPEAYPWRIRALTVRIDGEIKGIGGYVVKEDGSRLAFLEAKEDELKQHKITLQKAALRFFREIQNDGVIKLHATCDKNREAAARWLKRLGFEVFGNVRGEEVWKWHSAQH